MKVLVLLFILFLFACESPQNRRITGEQEKSTVKSLEYSRQDLLAEAQWLEGPFPSFARTNTLVVFLYNRNRELSSLPAGLELEFYSDMIPEMDHALEPGGEGAWIEVSVGIYLNESIRFHMGGVWNHQVFIKDQNQIYLDTVLWSEFI